MADFRGRNIQGYATSRALKGIFDLVGAGAPTNGTSGTGVNVAGPGSTYYDYTNKVYYQQNGTLASPTWVVDGLVNITGDVTIGASGISAIGAAKVLTGMLDPTLVQIATGTIVSADITGTSAGQLGHANGVPLVPAGGAHVVNEFISAIIITDFAVAAYTGGGNTGIKIGGGGIALSGVVANTVIIQAAADRVDYFNPLAATGLPLSENTSLNLVSASAPTQPGTAAGVIRYKVAYRQYATGL